MKRRNFLKSLIALPPTIVYGKVELLEKRNPVNSLKEAHKIVSSREIYNIPIEYGNVGILEIVPNFDYKLFGNSTEIQVREFHPTWNPLDNIILNRHWVGTKMNIPNYGIVPNPSYIVPLNEKSKVTIQYSNELINGTLYEIIPTWNNELKKFNPIYLNKCRLV